MAYSHLHIALFKKPPAPKTKKEMKKIPSNKPFILDDEMKRKVANYLTLEDLVSYRQTYKTTAKPLVGLLTWREFFLAIQGHQLFFKSYAYFMAAWDEYAITSRNKNNLSPAVLYKMIDPAHEAITRLLAHEAMGRVYTPSHDDKPYHCWSANLIWLYAQVQIGRPFFLISPLKNEYLFSTNHPGLYSAYFKEIAALIKIGYKVVLYPEAEDLNHILLLMPPSDTTKLAAIAQLKIHDLEPSKADIQLALKIVRPKQQQANEIKKSRTLQLMVFHALKHPALLKALLLHQYHIQPSATDIAAQKMPLGLTVRLRQSVKTADILLDKILGNDDYIIFLANHPDVLAAAYEDLIGYIETFPFDPDLKKQLIEGCNLRLQQIEAEIAEFTAMPTTIEELDDKPVMGIIVQNP